MFHIAALNLSAHSQALERFSPLVCLAPVVFNISGFCDQTPGSKES